MSDKFTWRELKRIANEIPEELLDGEVIGWPDEDDSDHEGLHVTGFEILDENYLFDGDEGCAPESVLRDGVSEEEFKDGDHYLIHPKGTYVLTYK